MKKIFSAALFLVSAVLCAGQLWQKDGVVELKSGDYTISVMPKYNGRISGFAFKGKELFIHQALQKKGENVDPATLLYLRKPVTSLNYQAVLPRLLRLHDLISGVNRIEK